MNERLVEDWLIKASERSYQTPFAQALLAEGMQVLRVGHGSHEHGKDIIAIDKNGKVHAYQLKDGDFNLSDFGKELAQITSLVEAQVEHPAISGHPPHQPWLVISGQTSMPVEDRIRTHNINWKKRRYKPLRTINGPQLLEKFNKMAADFWPQKPEDSRSLLSLYLVDGKCSLDKTAFAKLIAGIVPLEGDFNKADLIRKLSAVNLFTNYALSSFYSAKNHWEILQGWVIAAAHIAWAADKAKLSAVTWRPTFRLAVDAALKALEDLTDEALQSKALHSKGFELDTLTASRCTICAGALAVRVLIARKYGYQWHQKLLAKETMERLFSKERLFLWGESAVPFFLVTMWALDNLRCDLFSDRILLSVLSGVANQNGRHWMPKLPAPYDSADEANSKFLRRLFHGEKALELQSRASYTLESLVTLTAGRMWRNALASIWPQITEISLIRLVPDNPRDLLLWHWGHERGKEQDRLFGAPQSWRDLQIESRRNEDDSLPDVIKDEFDFALLFALCFPHRLNKGLVKFFENTTNNLQQW